MYQQKRLLLFIPLLLMTFACQTVMGMILQMDHEPGPRTDPVIKAALMHLDGK